MKYEAEFKLLLADLKKQREKANEEYDDCPLGTMHREKRNGKQKLFYVYEENNKRKRVVINGRREMQAALTRKRYLEEELAILDRDITALRRFISTYIEPTPETIIKRLPTKYQMMPEDYFFSSCKARGKTSVIQNGSHEEARRRWATEAYEQLNHKPEKKVQLTSRGLRVRTKSEVVVAEMLDAAGVPYRYEQVIYIEDFSFAPDFTIMTDRGIFYWEHAGMIHDEGYRDHHNWKMSMYEKAGIVPWKNLIVTYDNENGGLDTRIIRAEIENKLL